MKTGSEGQRDVGARSSATGSSRQMKYSELFTDNFQTADIASELVEDRASIKKLIGQFLRLPDYCSDGTCMSVRRYGR